VSFWLKIKQKTTANLTITITPHTDQIGTKEVPPVMVVLSTLPLNTYQSIIDGLDNTTIYVTSNGTTTTTLEITGKLVGKEIIRFAFHPMTGMVIKNFV
jgi:hypothetical protein